MSLDELEQQEYKGFFKWNPTDEELAEFFATGKHNFKVNENQYVYLMSKDDKDKVDKIYKCKNGKLVSIAHPSFKSPKSKNDSIAPRNNEQKCAFDLLTDDSIGVKLITGHWGTGKTFLLVAGAVDALRKRKFEQIVWVRNNVRLEDTPELGALPGDKDEKLMGFLGPFVDHCGKLEVENMIKKEELVIEPLQSLRGRNFENSIIICSESENLTKKQIQLIIARCAEGSEVWFDGDTRQRDKVIFKKSKGLEGMIRDLTGNELFGYIHLIKGERSKVAALADLIEDNEGE